MESHEHLAGAGVIKPGYAPRLTNEDLAPLKKQTWTSYNFFAFWMSDVHSVGGYVTAGSLFALGLAAWQVLIALLVGITIVYFLCNLVARPSPGHRDAVPGRIADLVRRARREHPGHHPRADRGGLVRHPDLSGVGGAGVVGDQAVAGTRPVRGGQRSTGSPGCRLLGWIGFGIMWIAQAIVFWRGMESIRKFIDFCGPAVYVVMFLLAGYLVIEAGWENIDFNLAEGGITLTGWAVLPVLLSAIALVVSYFSGPMLNYGDFARYGKSFGAVKKGNFLGLPVNFLVFSLLVVVTAAATRPVFGELIIDPVHTVAKLDNVYAVILGALTFMIATVGINIVANFVSPAFDFSNVNPQKISWRMGGMIAAVGSVLITPWNLYNSPETIHYTLDTLGAFIGPLYGVLIADYYLVKKRQVDVDALYTLGAERQVPLQEGLQPGRRRGDRDLRHRRDGRGVLRLRRGGDLHLVHRRRAGLRPVHDRQPDVRGQGQLPGRQRDRRSRLIASLHVRRPMPRVRTGPRHRRLLRSTAAGFQRSDDDHARSADARC